MPVFAGRKRVYFWLALLFLLWAGLRWGAGFYIDYLWYRSLHYEQVFWTTWLTQWGLKLGVFALYFIVLLPGLWPAASYLRTALSHRRVYSEQENVIVIEQEPAIYSSGRWVMPALVLFCLLVATMAGAAASSDWATLQRFLHPAAFKISDPVFHRDIGFYVFQLPVYRLIYGLLQTLLIILLLASAALYWLADLRQGIKGIFTATRPRYNLSLLAALFFLLLAWGYRLKQYGLLCNPAGIVYGASYTDLHATLPAYKILFFVSIFCAIVILVNAFLRKFRYVLFTIAFLVLAALTAGGIYPLLLQKFVVLPDELNKEKVPLENHIKFTRMAYQLNRIVEKPFPAGQKLTAADLQANRDAVNSIRLWDYRPLQQTYSQLQEMRLYYELRNIDVDRYEVNGLARQVMLAARELNQEQLPAQAQTWVNKHLKYTHGYGVVVSPVNEVSEEGLPHLWVRDIPPVTSVGLKIDRPEIYFGELTNNYVIVNTRAQEFDYPQGDANAYTTYRGKDGVYVGGLARRLLFAFVLGDYKLLFSTEVTPDSRVLFNRNIAERVQKLAPFLLYDQDPYIVISQGRLYWMWDAYTYASGYPYSEPFSGSNNYIRNAVKVVIDAYNGTVDFYLADTGDPLIQSYIRIFPGMFKPLNQMPGDLQKHLRYPEDLFKIQARKYAVFHMENPQVFYNKEDKWIFPTELFGSEEQVMEPYYTITRLPGENRSQYLLILPFTPQNKKNMVAWLAARSDQPAYGELVLYEFPKQELVYGPMQIEARISQDTYISQQLTLWDQRGSSVIRGNLLVIPVKNSLIYVEPLYLQAEQSKMPELRRVIVAHGDMIVMENTLDNALKRIFGQGAAGAPPLQAPEQQAPTTAGLSDLINQARALMQEAEQRLKNADWAGYGEAQQKLKAVLENMARAAHQ